MATTSIVTIFAAVSAVASATAALGALIQVRTLAQGSEANAYLRLVDRYSAPAMRESIVELSDLWREARRHGLPVVEAYLQLYAGDKVRANQIQGHCRLLSSYFIDATRLYEAGLISKKVLSLAIAHPGLNTFYEVAVPLNEHKAGGHNSVWAKEVLKHILPVHGSGMY